MHDYFIKVFFGSDDEVLLQLPEKEQFTLGNQIGCDVFLANKAREAKYYVEFKCFDQQIVILNTTHQIFDHHNQLVEVGTAYALPSFWIIDDVKFAVASSSTELANWPDIPAVNESLLTTEDATHDDVDTGLVTFDDSKMSKFKILSYKITTLLARAGSASLRSAKAIAQLTKRYLLPVTKLIVNKLDLARRKYSLIFYLSVTFIVVSGLFIAIALYYTHTNKNLIKHQEQQIETGTLIKQRFLELSRQYPNLQFKRNSNEIGYEISGVVPDDKALQKVYNTFQTIKSQIKYHLITAPQAIKKIEQILANYQINNVQTQFDGQEMVLSGVVANFNNLNNAEIEISNQLTMINLDSSNVFDQTLVLQDLNTAITGFDGQIKVDYDFAKQPPMVAINGYLDKDDVAKLDKQLGEFKQKYPIIQVNLSIKNILKALPFKIYTVYTGDPAFIMTDSGQRIFVGGSINGFHLSKITDTQIVFTGKVPLVLNIDNVLNDSGASHEFAPSNDTSGRQEIIQQEFSQLQQSIIDEKQQLADMTQYKQKITDPKLQDYISKLAQNLTDDIEVKQHEVTNYHRRGKR